MSLASSVAALFDNEKPVTAAMAYYDPIKGEEDGSGFKAFQYFPEKIMDNKSVDYTQKIIPGGSHPIYTFISGSERTISFDAIFVNDDAGFSATSLLKGKSYNLKDVSNRDIQDIAAALTWLRHCMYPSYQNGVAKSPPLVVLYLPNSGIIGAGNYNESVVGFIRRADITYESFYRDGKPRIAVVSVELVEVIQTQKNWKFQDNSEFSSDKYKRQASSQATNLSNTI